LSGSASTRETEQGIDALVIVAPAAAAVFAMMTLTLNLWLATKITATSGRLHRPWPDLKSTALPPMTLAALSIAIALCFSGGLLAILARVVTGALMMSYALVGFAVLHTLTLALKHRALWLICTYVAVAVFSWPVLAMAVLGLADAVFGIRRRYLQGRPPPLPAS
jgi:mannose/fructose/N-acetylgalactosamine-specific phosphotransferase system component IIC